ncbi:MAG: c-type cytochrome domain-containing protein [Pirellulaceae bacterium]
MTRKEEQLLRMVGKDLDDVASGIERERYPQAAKAYESAVSRIQRFGEMTSTLASQFGAPKTRLEEYRTKLTEAGQEVSPVPDIASGGLSFQTDVAPILVGKCGGCHVRGSRGGFGMANFAALIQSGMVEPGDPVSSRLIQVIDSGEMPQGGGTVTNDELTTLRSWITAGAKNDGDAQASLTQLSGAAANGSGNNQPALEMKDRIPTGTETVSFTRDVAPILVEECNGCHLNAQRVRGGLNMSNFTSLLRGGDNGAMLDIKNSSNSLLIKKLLGTGSGNRMPPNQKPLSKEVVGMIEKWISEGAKFDATDAALPLERLAAMGTVAKMSHDELVQKRKEIAEANWKKAMSSEPINRLEVGDVTLVSTLPPEKMQPIAEKINELIEAFKNDQKLKSGTPLVTGNSTVYLFERRYDFNEFGVMVLGHPIPREQLVARVFDRVDSHVAVIYDRDVDQTQIAFQLFRALIANHVANWTEDVPKWFADGLAYDLASEFAGEQKTLVEGWQKEAMTVLSNGSSSQIAADKLDLFLNGGLSDVQQSLGGYFCVAKLKSTPSFKRFVDEVKKGQSFQATFGSLYGSSFDELMRASLDSRRR